MILMSEVGQKKGCYLGTISMIGTLTGEGVAGGAQVKKKHCNFHLETLSFQPRRENKSC